MEPHMSPQSQQLDDHLDGEHHSEDHVQDVHDGREQFGLLVMLGGKQHRTQSVTVQHRSCVILLDFTAELCGTLPEPPE